MIILINILHQSPGHLYQCFRGRTFLRTLLVALSVPSDIMAVSNLPDHVWYICRRRGRNRDYSGVSDTSQESEFWESYVRPGINLIIRFYSLVFVPCVLYENTCDQKTKGEYKCILALRFLFIYSLKINNIKHYAFQQLTTSKLKPKESFGEFDNIFLDFQKVQEIIIKHNQTVLQLFWMTYCIAILPCGKSSLCT